jgi:glycosyltransferase involved in cell wall biosynthesis
MPEQKQDRHLGQKMMSERPLLTIAYSTLPNRVKAIVFPERRADREVLVQVQNPQEISYVVSEKSAKIIEMRSVGVAKSRNAAIERASGKYLLFADDDITFSEAGITEALEYFEANPDCAIALTQAKDDSGALRKEYFKEVKPLRLTNSARAATYELMIRVDAFREKGIKFDENFGAGAENYLGDEYIFISDALRAGLKGVHLPVVLATHPTESSGSRWGSEQDLSARQKVFSRVFGWRAPLYRAAFLMKTKNPNPGLMKSLKFIFKS